MITKNCSKCETSKNVSEFYKDKKSTDGYYGTCKKCKAKSDNIRWHSNVRVRLVNKIAKDNARFGIDTEKYVEGKKCELCGMTDFEHKNKYGERLNIHHIDGKGRRSERLGLDVNNSMENFAIICRSCHCGETNRERKKLKQSIQ